MEATALKSEWAALLAESLVKEESVPRGWKTAEQIAAEIGKSLPHTGALLRAAIKAGSAERKKFRVRAGGVCRPVWHYSMCSPEDFEQEEDEALSPQEQIGNRKHDRRVGEKSKSGRREKVSVPKSRVSGADESDRKVRSR